MDSEIQLSNVYKNAKNRLIEKLKRFAFEITAFNSDLSKVTIGGVDLNNNNSKILGSNLISELYFAMEVLDLHGYTGDFNLKIAF